MKSVESKGLDIFHMFKVETQEAALYEIGLTDPALAAALQNLINLWSFMSPATWEPLAGDARTLMWELLHVRHIVYHRAMTFSM